MLAHEVAASPGSADTGWRGLPPGVSDGATFPVRRDELEFRLETLLDVLTAHALRAGVGGRAQVTAMLLTPQTTVPQVNVALLNEAVDESDQPAGWRLACARAREPLADVVALPMTTRLQLADMPNLRTRLQAAHHLAAELLALFGIDEPTLLKPDGTLDPYGAGLDRQLIAYQHANHLGLPVDEISPQRAAPAIPGRGESSPG